MCGWLALTSAVLGTLSQKTSIFMSPRFVCSVTDIVAVVVCVVVLGCLSSLVFVFGGWKFGEAWSFCARSIGT